MPPRYSYWTILAGGLPTAFRAADREELLPTFRRIRDKHPDAEMKWFARGRLWSSPEEAQADLHKARARRDRHWRPGGDHRDPRQKFEDAKRARNLSWRQEKFARKTARTQPATRERSSSDAVPPSAPRPPRTRTATSKPRRPHKSHAENWKRKP